MQADKLSRSTLLLLGAGIAFILSLPLWMPINGHDGWIHLNWLEQFTRLFREGDLYPRWMSDSFSGFGSPAFYVYPPLTYWFASLLSLTGLHNGESLYFAVTVISVFASGTAFFMYAKVINSSKQSSLLGALCYSLAPYAMVDIAIRNALSEHFAFVWIPFIFLGIERWIVAEKAGKKRTIGAALFIFTTASLALTNIPVFIIICVSSVIYILSRKSKRSITMRLLLLAVGFICVSLMTAFYFGTAFKVQSQLSVSYLWSIFSGMPIHRWMLGIGVQYQHFRDLFLALILLFGILTSVINSTSARQYALVRSIVALSLIAVVFQIPYITDWVFTLPIIQYIQFDQRWNVVLTFTTAVSIVVLFDKGHKYATAILTAVVGCAACIPVVVGLFFSNPPSQEVVRTYHNDPPEYISKYVKDTSITYPAYFSSLVIKKIVEGTDSISLNRVGPSTYEITKFAEAEVDVRFPLQYFSFWWLSEPRMKEIPLTTDSSGILNATLPKGKGKYYLTQVVKGSGSYDLISVVSILLTTVILAAVYFKDKLLKFFRKIK